MILLGTYCGVALLVWCLGKGVPTGYRAWASLTWPIRPIVRAIDEIVDEFEERANATQKGIVVAP